MLHELWGSDTGAESALSLSPPGLANDPVTTGLQSLDQPTRHGLQEPADGTVICTVPGT